jgi:hypothetical protein
MQARVGGSNERARPLNRFATAVIGGLVLGAVPAEAALKQFSTTVDVSSCNFASHCAVSTAMPTQTFAVNDVVDYTVDFTGNQRIIMTDIFGGTEMFVGWLHFSSAAGLLTISNPSITLLDQSGSLASPLAKASETSIGPIGPSFFNHDLIGVGSSVSFTGYRIKYTVIALPANPTSYSANFLQLSADRLEVFQDVAAMPEPTTLALTAIGLMGLAIGRRRWGSARR